MANGSGIASRGTGAVLPTEAKPDFERPPLREGHKDYSSSHDTTFAACEIDIAYSGRHIEKIGNLTAILDAHFPNSREVYRLHDKLVAALKDARRYVETCSDHPFDPAGELLIRIKHLLTDLKAEG